MSSRHNTFNDPSASAGTTQAFGVNDTDQIVLNACLGSPLRTL